MNSKEILNTFEKNIYKIKEIDIKRAKISDIKNQHIKNIDEIFNLYTILFKGFLSSRIKTSVFFKKENNWYSKEIILNKNGISYRYQNDINSHDILEINNKKDILEMIEFISKNKSDFVNTIPLNVRNRTDKIELINNFFSLFEDFTLLGDIEKEIEKIEIKVLNNYNDDKIEINKVNKISGDENGVYFKLDGDKENTISSLSSISFTNSSIDNLALIEQVYDECLNFLDYYEKLAVVEFEKSKKTLLNIKDKFKTTLLLNKIKKGSD